MNRLLLLILAGMLCLPFFSPAHAAGELTILYNGNTYGEYRPCPT
jgi:hypothetical protein